MAEALCLGNFDVLETLGAGSFSTVIKARPKLRPELSVVLKETRGVQGSAVTRANVGREVEMLKAARGCAFVSQFYAAFIEGDSHYMVMEYVPGGDLLKTVQQCMAAKTPPDEPTLWRYLYELGQGVAFLHAHGIVHRDIKCQNIMLSSSGHIKLIDLGLAAAIAPGQCLTERCGTPFYMAVEMINKQPYDQRVDVWSSGCVFYMLAQLRPAFNGQNLQSLCRSIIEDVPAPLCPKRFSPPLSSLILRMLDKRREARPTMEEVLSHPVFAHYPHFPPASQALFVQQYPQQLRPDPPLELVGAPPPTGYAATAATAYHYHHHHQQQQQQQILLQHHLPACVTYTQVPVHARVGGGATGAGEVGVYAQQPPPEAQHQQQPPMPLVMGEPDDTAAAAVAGVGVEEEEDIIDPVLPDLALQDSEQLTDVPLAAEGEAGPQLVSVTPTTHLLTPATAATAAAILSTTEGALPVPPPPLIVGRAQSLPLVAPSPLRSAVAANDDADVDTVSTTPLPPAIIGLGAGEGTSARLARLFPAPRPLPLTRTASSPTPTQAGGEITPNPTTPPPAWAGRSPLRPQRGAAPLPSSPRVRELTTAAAHHASLGSSVASAASSSSHKRALVELEDRGADAALACASSFASSLAGDEPSAALSSSLGTPKRTRRAASGNGQPPRQHRVVQELLASGGGLERTLSSPGRLMGARFRLEEQPPPPAHPPAIDACVSSTSLASGGGQQQQLQQQQQQLQACFAALALPSPSSKQRRDGGDDGSCASSLSDSCAGFPLGLLSPGSAGGGGSAPGTPLRRSPRRRKGQGQGQGLNRRGGAFFA